jgi:hypothetical protein
VIEHGVAIHGRSIARDAANSNVRLSFHCSRKLFAQRIESGHYLATLQLAYFADGN